MGKGVHSDTSTVAIAYLHGRIDAQIEQFCLTTGISLDEASQRVAFLLHPVGQRVQDQVLPMPVAPRPGQNILPEMEGLGDSHGTGTYTETEHEAVPGRQVKHKRRKKRKLTPEGRAKIVKSVKAMWARKRREAKANA